MEWKPKMTEEPKAHCDSGTPQDKPAEPEAVALARLALREAESIQAQAQALVRDRLALDNGRQAQKILALHIEVQLYAGKDEKSVGSNAEARARALALAIAENTEYQQREQGLMALRDEITVRASHLDELREVNKCRLWLVRALTPSGGQNG